MKVLILCMMLTIPSAALLDRIGVKVCYTQWFDCDDPSGTGDWETVENLEMKYPGKICKNPLAIEAQTLSGVPAQQTGQLFIHQDLLVGFICLNSQQKKDRLCRDYKVRFRCPCPWPWYEIPAN
ncbi:cartilage intermediate layer protein 1-like isoform X2 [Brachyhypopomus gauderio]|uniref:cartilage intermediate layer protein 1-like isoform X2 n=1 Tax=Brachyhypopomus gauderio TaxID=698409 RepID=UPI00404314E1